MLTPNLATALRPGRVVAGALVLGLGLLGAPTHRVTAPPIACPLPLIVAVVPVTPDANAADLVGIYKSSECTLTLDASGTYLSDCSREHGQRYTISGDQLAIGPERLTISGRGRLVASDGTIFSITGGTR